MLRITDNIYLELYNPLNFFCVGIYNERTLAAWIPEEQDEPSEEELEEMNRLVIGLLFGGITIIY